MKRVYYGWWVAAAATLCVAISVGTIGQCMSLFIRPISEDLQLPRASVSVLVSIIAFGYALISLFWGKLYKSLPIWTLMLAGSIGLPVCCFCLSLAQSLPVLYLLTVLASICETMLSILTFTTVLSNWFHAKRGLVLGVMSAGCSIGGTFFSWLSGILIATSGWSGAFRIFGLIQAVVLIPLVILVIRIHPANKGLAPYGETTEEVTEQSTVTPAKLTPRFWAVVVLISLICLCNMGGMSTLNAYLLDLGYSTIFSANALSAYMAIVAVFTVVMGVFIDRKGIRLADNLMIICTVLGLVCLIFAQYGIAVVIVCVVLAALGMTFGYISIPFLVNRVCQDGDTTSAFGIASAISSVGGMVAPILCNAVYDATKSYVPAFIGLLILTVICFVALQFALGETKNNRLSD